MAATRARKKGVTLTGVEGVAEKLPFETGSFDAVVSTLVFCSVRDPAAALQEVCVCVCVYADVLKKHK